MTTTRQVKRPSVQDANAWESYRLHQRDVLLVCYEDAELMMRRLRLPPTDEEKRFIVGLLWDKRCRPWKYFRDEQRAMAALR